MQMLVNAKEFSKMSGFPLSVIRRLCREGKIPFWDFHTCYLMEPDKAYDALLSLQGPGNIGGSSEEEGSSCKPKAPRNTAQRTGSVKRGRKLCRYRSLLEAASLD